MEMYMGLIMPSAIPYIPDQNSGTPMFAACQGQQMSVNNNQALYAIIGNIYGGNTAQFNLPDLRGRVIVGTGTYTGNEGTFNYTMAQKGGAVVSTISLANMPVHNHQAVFTPNGSGQGITPYVTLPAFDAAGSLSVSANVANTNIPSSTDVPSQVPPITDSGGAQDSVVTYGPADGTTAWNVGVKVAPTQTNLPVEGGANIGGGTVTVANNGASTPFNQMQPYLALYYFIVVYGLFPPH